MIEALDLTLVCLVCKGDAVIGLTILDSDQPELAFLTQPI